MTDSIQPTDKNRPAASRVQWKTVSAISAATWLATAQLSGCADEQSSSTTTEPAMTDDAHSGHTTTPPATTGGEGAGGEGEGAATAGAEFVTDDAAYITQLALIRGHLAVGYALYQNDLPELAETHMKHPRAEIYTIVEPAFAARGCSGFGDGLSALTASVTERGSQEQVTAAYESLVAGISACEAGADTQDPIIIAQVIESLLRTAGIEYAIGVVDGKMDNLHEYQDAWGFTQIAQTWAQSSAFATDPKATAVAAQLQSLISSLDGLWPSLNPEGGVDGKAAQLYGAAGQVQVIALALTK